ncbi:hypothetical protein IscW_ISCW012824, partial [Ixodes scapularis]
NNRARDNPHSPKEKKPTRSTSDLGRPAGGIERHGSSQAVGTESHPAGIRGGEQSQRRRDGQPILHGRRGRSAGTMETCKDGAADGTRFITVREKSARGEEQEEERSSGEETKKNSKPDDVAMPKG